MRVKRIIKNTASITYDMLNRLRKLLSRTWYSISGKQAWKLGYIEYRWHLTHRLLKDSQFLSQLQNRTPFTPYGVGLDERVIEYPWVFASLAPNATKMLDAGSALNFLPLIKILKGHGRELTIFTLAPERKCHWREAVSYHYGNLKNLPFQSEWFDEIACISTLEHVGMDNRNYGIGAEQISEEDFVVAMREMARVLRPNGNFLITVPYGARDYVTWRDATFMRQFDAELLQMLINATPDIVFEVQFFRYIEAGWQASTQEACADAHYFNIHTEKTTPPDRATAARAIACLRGIKRA